MCAKRFILTGIFLLTIGLGAGFCQNPYSEDTVTKNVIRGIENLPVPERIGTDLSAEIPKPVLKIASEAAFPKKQDSLKIENIWKKAGMSGSLSVMNLPSNGGRPAAVYLPPKFDPSKPAKVVTLFHGHYWNIGDQFNVNKVFARIKELEEKNPNTIFVIPQAANPPFSYWMKPPKESYTDLMSQALGEAARMAKVPSLKISERIVAAHSGGGLAIRNVVTSGQMQADKIELLDANYGDWGAVMTKWAMKVPEGKRPHITAWDTAGDTRTHDGEIAKLGPDVVTVSKSTVVHNSVPAKYFGSTIDQ
jgi:hypothetical protein